MVRRRKVGRSSVHHQGVVLRVINLRKINGGVSVQIMLRLFVACAPRKCDAERKVTTTAAGCLFSRPRVNGLGARYNIECEHEVSAVHLL